jgi:hypothetical protein
MQTKKLPTIKEYKFAHLISEIFGDSTPVAKINASPPRHPLRTKIRQKALCQHNRCDRS